MNENANHPPITLRHLAKMAGVSHSTVSRALRGDPRISSATRDRIQLLADESGYRANPFVAAFIEHLRTGADLPVASLAFLYSDRKWMRFPQERRLLEAARAEAGLLGFSLEIFYANEMQVPAIERILRSRGIRGVILRVPDDSTVFEALDLSPFAAASIFISRTRFPIHHTNVSQHHVMDLALNEIRRAGYTRPALLYPQEFEQVTEHQIIANFTFLSHAFFGRRGPVLIVNRTVASERQESDIGRFLDRHEVDFLLTHDSLRPALEKRQKAGYPLPEMAVLDTGESPDSLPGTCHQRDRLATAAVDVVAGMLTRNVIGYPSAPQSILFEPAWKGALRWKTSDVR